MSKNDQWASSGRSGLLVVLVAAGLFFCAGTAWAQVFRLGTWEGSVEGVFSFTRDDTKTGGQHSRLDDILTEERLNIRNNGAYILDPRIVTLSLGASVGLFQDHFSFEGDSRTNLGTLWGYDLFAGVLPDQPLSLNVFASRDQSVISRELAGRTESTTESRGATLFSRSFYIPSTLTVRQELLDEETSIANVVARRLEQRDIFRYEGRRGWIDSELGLLYEFIDDTDRVNQSFSFRSHDAQANYTLDFGEELNRHWDSTLRFYTRTGLFETTVWTADESLRVDHTDQLRTDYRYSFIRTDAANGANTTHTAIARLEHQLYESLTTTASLDGVRQTFPQGERDSVRGRVGWVYRKRLPLGGQLTAGLGGSLQYEDDRFNTTEVSISQESHTAGSPFALPIPLDNPFVVASSVVVTKTAIGPLPLGCIPPSGPPVPLVVGTDFTLETTGDITQIAPIACSGTTIGINPGDTIAVDYHFTVSPARSFLTEQWNADLSVDYHWIRVYFLHDQSNQTLISGRDGRFLTDQISDTIGAELRYDSSRLHASLVGEARRVRSTQIDYDTLRGSGFADFAILPELTFRLNADYTFTEFSHPSRETRNLSARAGLTYTLGATLFADASAGYRRFEDTAQATDQLFEARLQVRWLFRKLEIVPSLEFFDRERGDTTSTEYRAMLRTIRRF
jgi:hypothetical protein